jgi:hypothetical protein
MQRILRGVSGEMSVSFDVDGVPVDPTFDEANVTLTDTAGTVLYSGPAADSGTGFFTLPLLPSWTVELGVLRATWSLVYGGETQVLVTEAEIVGGFLFALGDLRAVKPLEDESRYPADVLIDTRSTVEDALENACGCSFVPRYRVETVYPTGGPVLVLERPLVSRVRSIVSDGVAYTVDEIANVIVHPSGTIFGPWGWRSRYWGAPQHPLTIAYEHGFVTPPAEVKRAGLILAKDWLVERTSPIDPRATSFTGGDGGSYPIAAAGVGGSWFGNPSVDSVVDRYRMAAGVA